MTVFRITKEAAADLIRKDLESKGYEIERIFAHTAGYTIEVKPKEVRR